jgi:alpha-D-xyloside xylohydrolase
MLRQRRFNIVLVTSDAPQALNLEKPEGKLVVYDGQQVSVQL